MVQVVHVFTTLALVTTLLLLQGEESWNGESLALHQESLSYYDDSLGLADDFRHLDDGSDEGELRQLKSGRGGGRSSKSSSYSSSYSSYGYG